MPRPAAPALARRLLARWHGAECVLAVAALAFMALVLVLDAAGREALGPLLRALDVQAGPTGIQGAPKLALYALMLATYAGLGIATACGTHLVPRVAFPAVPASWAPTVDRLADLLTGAFLLAVAWVGLDHVQGSRALGLRVTALQWPLWPLQLMLPIGFASAALRSLCFAAWPALRPRRSGIDG